MPAIDALHSAPDKAFEEVALVDFGLETLIGTPTSWRPALAPRVTRSSSSSSSCSGIPPVAPVAIAASRASFEG
jgi:hypothetical protein